MGEGKTVQARILPTRSGLVNPMGTLDIQSVEKEAGMVSDKIVRGIKGRKETVVCEHNVAGHVDRFSTPSMISLMEQASYGSIQHLLEPNQISVGYEVNIRHLAPSSKGARIVARSELTEIERNRLTFNVEAYDGETKIGEGVHRRAIISSDAGKL